MDTIVRPNGLYVDSWLEAIQLAADRIEVALDGPSSVELHREGQPRAAA